MAFLSLLINLIITLSPAIAIFIYVICSSAQLVILSMGGTFFWLIGIFIYSTLWVLITPIQSFYFVTIPVSVLITELARFSFWMVYDKVYNQGLLGDSFVRPTDFQVSISAGWSFGVTQALLFHVSTVFDGYGPGFIGFPSCSSISLFYIQSVIMSGLILFHVLLGIIAFDAYKNKSIVGGVILAIVHVAYSSISILNTFNISCFVSIIFQYVILIITAIYTWRANLISTTEYAPVKLE